jgi:hypothetical protein
MIDIPTTGHSAGHRFYPGQPNGECDASCSKNNEEKQKVRKLFISVHSAKEKLDACRWVKTVVDENLYSFRRRRRRH